MNHASGHACTLYAYFSDIAFCSSLSQKIYSAYSAHECSVSQAPHMPQAISTYLFDTLSHDSTESPTHDPLSTQ